MAMIGITSSAAASTGHSKRRCMRSLRSSTSVTSTQTGQRLAKWQKLEGSIVDLERSFQNP
jgi:hypothetical protein